MYSPNYSQPKIFSNLLNLWFRVEQLIEKTYTQGNALDRQLLISTYEAEETLIRDMLEMPLGIKTENIFENTVINAY